MKTNLSLLSSLFVFLDWGSERKSVKDPGYHCHQNHPGSETTLESNWGLCRRWGHLFQSNLTSFDWRGRGLCLPCDSSPWQQLGSHLHSGTTRRHLSWHNTVQLLNSADKVSRNWCNLILHHGLKEVAKAAGGRLHFWGTWTSVQDGRPTSATNYTSLKNFGSRKFRCPVRCYRSSLSE